MDRLFNSCLVRLEEYSVHACMVSCFSYVQLFVTLWIVAHQVAPGGPSRVLRGDPKAFGLPVQWLYPLMMAEKESRKDGMQRRCRTLFLAGGISNRFSCIPYSKHHSAFFKQSPVANTSSRHSSCYTSSPFPSPPSGGGIMNSKMYRKTIKWLEKWWKNKDLVIFWR